MSSFIVVPHAPNHKSAGSDPIRLDELKAPTDVATLDASIAAHGLLKKLPNDATKYMDGTGAWSVPAGGGLAAGPFAWVTFNGQGVLAVLASYGVTGVTDLGGNGIYRITFSSAQAHANFCAVFGQSMDGGVAFGCAPQMDSAVPPTTTTVNIQTFTMPGGVGHDFDRICGAFFI